jgi:hypothetical protein
MFGEPALGKSTSSNNHKQEKHSRFFHIVFLFFLMDDTKVGIAKCRLQDKCPLIGQTQIIPDPARVPWCDPNDGSQVLHGNLLYQVGFLVHHFFVALSR